MMRISLLVLALAAVCDGILPEIVYPGVDHILEDYSAPGQTEPGRPLVEVEQLQEAPQQNPQDATHPRDIDSVSPDPGNLPPDHHNESASDKVIDNESVHTSSVDLENHNVTTTTVPYSDLGNTIDHGCITDEDCGKGRYCLNVMHGSKCLPCKAIDVSCTKDEECCADELCVWGQCSPNATKGDAGSTCQYQTDCSPDLCCAFHKALLFPVCLAKPIERERCFGASNHLAELLSWDSQDKGPRKHCPCAGDLHCQHLGRGSMCLKGEDSSEEDMADTLYSEIDYII
ncbi:dickkopf-related protein 3a [Hippoglossus stenolepis]|uniref:dickkopf-related protein 3a n=1 Tax=Hippoglossus stenolepis TaxID=195615 RepID=UPI00159C3BC0|nr:dickkopf-related protein 3a [Hippoglossus stenolepis]